MTGRLAGKIAIVVGANGPNSIGGGVCARLARDGASVLVADFNVEGARDIAMRICRDGGTAASVEVDIGVEASVEAMIAEVVARFGGLDIIHINAADTNIRYQDTDAVTVPMEVYEQTIRVGLTGHLLCTRHAIPKMLERGGGAIIYTSSDSAFQGLGHFVSYVMAKSGVNALMRHVATRWGKDNIRANAISPGLVLTDTVLQLHSEESQSALLAKTMSPRVGRPDDIAAMVAFLGSDDAAWINGQVYSVNGGLLMR